MFANGEPINLGKPTDRYLRRTKSNGQQVWLFGWKIGNSAFLTVKGQIYIIPRPERPSS